MEANEQARRRLTRTIGHLIPREEQDGNAEHFVQAQNCKSVILVNNEPRSKEKLKWNGWGYEDSKFALNERGHVYFTGKRYEMAGIEMPHFRPWIEENCGLNVEENTPSQPFPAKWGESIKNNDFITRIGRNYSKISFETLDRVNHSHGHTAQEIFDLRHGKMARIVDCVIWPMKHSDVELIVKAANDCNVVIIPYGGGTSVSHALLCPETEKRMIVSLDMHDMDKIKWVDRENMTACIEAGIVGKDLVRKLEDIGLTMGHEPDSLEFSTLGGWIATRASGMKKNRYGNIEDIIVRLKIVTPVGTFERNVLGPRVSTGPDVNQMIMGSEGTLGVITEAVVKISDLPEVRRYSAIVFPNFEKGVQFMQEIALNKTAPASIRLVDPEQFAFGQALKPAAGGLLSPLIEKAKKFYVTKYHGFDPTELCAATIVFEGSKEVVKAQEKAVYAIAKQFNGLKADAENGKRGYFLTYMIAYIRDLGFEHGFIAESFETSVPWSRTYELCLRVKARIRDMCKAAGVAYQPLVSCRVTQTYDAGACVYFYIGFVYRGLKDPVGTFSHIEHSAREEIMKCGGSISHHHGVGKHRKSFMNETIGPVGIEMLRGLKNSLDPKNIFANGNLIDVDPSTPSSNHH